MRIVAFVSPDSVIEMISYSLARVLGRVRIRVSDVIHSKLFALRKQRYLGVFTNKKGLEIGGPSPMFRHQDLFPVYPLLENLDGCNFGAQTVWEGALKAGPYYRYADDKPPGYQFLCEATDLRDIPAGRYDVILCSHALEHIANPLKAIGEWLRVLREDGILLLVLPYKCRTFDHRRPSTTFFHLLEDHQRGVCEDDLTHLDEILRCHDLSLDLAAGTFEKFQTRSRNNFENRCLHHHVFDRELLFQVFRHFGLTTIAFHQVPPIHIFIIGVKTGYLS